MINYKFFKISIGEKLNRGASKPRWGMVSAVAKRAHDDHGIALGNEIASAKLANLLNLPIPPFGIAHCDDEPWFFSADFNPGRLPIEKFTPDGKVPREADWTRIVTNRPAPCWAIILFDIWTVNQDRNPGNIICQPNTDALMIFDHGASLLGENPAKKLKNHKDSIFCLGRRDDKGVEIKHPLAKYISDSKGYEDWLRKIKMIPNWQIRDAVNSARQLGYKKEQAEEVFQFLIERRTKLPELIADEVDLWFPNLSEDAKNKISEIAKKQ